MFGVGVKELSLSGNNGTFREFKKSIFLLV